MIQERVRAGLARAVAEGTKLGRPKIDTTTEKDIRAALAKGDAGMHKIAARRLRSTRGLGRVPAGRAFVRSTEPIVSARRALIPHAIAAARAEMMDDEPLTDDERGARRGVAQASVTPATGPECPLRRMAPASDDAAASALKLDGRTSIR
jgi:hypothetical protein